MRLLSTIIVYIFITSSAVAAATKSPSTKNFIAQYDLYHNEMFVGKSTRTLKTENNLVSFTSLATTAGVAAWFFDITITEISILKLRDNQLHFFSYSYDEKGNDKDKKYHLNLDKLNKFYNSHTKEYYPVNKSLHDTLGFTVAIMREMQSGKREIKYSIAEKDSLKTYSLKLLGKENIPTNSGVISTFKMEHYDPESKHRFTLWCAEKFGFLPVRIQNINSKGDESLLNLTKFNQTEMFLDLFDEEDD